MLGQAAAMLIPFPATIAAEVGRDTLPVDLHLSTLTGSAVAALGLAVRGVGVARGGLASDRRFLTGAVYASRKVGTES